MRSETENPRFEADPQDVERDLHSNSVESTNEAFQQLRKTVDTMETHIDKCIAQIESLQTKEAVRVLEGEELQEAETIQVLTTTVERLQVMLATFESRMSEISTGNQGFEKLLADFSQKNGEELQAIKTMLDKLPSEKPQLDELRKLLLEILNEHEQLEASDQKQDLKQLAEQLRTRIEEATNATTGEMNPEFLTRLLAAYHARYKAVMMPITGLKSQPTDAQQLNRNYIGGSIH